MELTNIKNVSSFVWNMLLYSALGCFSLFFLVHYADIPIHHQGKLMTVKLFASTVIMFNGIGFTLKYIENWLIRTYPSFIRDKKMLVVFLGMSAFFLLVVNYFLLVVIKFLINIPQPFFVATEGICLLVIIFLVELFIIGQMMVCQFYKSMVKMYRYTKDLEDSAAKTHYMALQSQLNPHFLFNSLNTLVSEIEYAPKKAVEFTRNLSDIYRYILSCQNKYLVAVNEEIDFIDKLVFLHQVRLGNCIKLDNRIPKDIYEYSIPPLTLQLLVENVIKHNVISPSKPMSISLYVEKEEGNQCWLVISNPVYLKQGVPASGMGLNNLSQRNKLLFQKEIVIKNKDNYFTVKVPIFNIYE